MMSQREQIFQPISFVSNTYQALSSISCLNQEYLLNCWACLQGNLIREYEAVILAFSITLYMLFDQKKNRNIY